MSAEKQLSRWDALVSEIEGGYARTIYEYLDDLGIRDQLADLLASIPSARGVELIDALAVLDDRFRSATEELDQPLVHDASPQQWWWRRVPLARDAEFDADIATWHAES